MRKISMADRLESFERVSKMHRALSNGVPWCVVSAEFKPTPAEVRAVNRRLRNGIRPER